MSRHTANRVNLPASRYGRSRPNWGSSGSGLADSAPGRLLRSASTFLRDGGKGACAGLARRCRHAVRRPWLRPCRDCRVSLRLCAHPCAALARTELLRRTAPTAPMYHPALPGPPAWGCFTAPPFQAEVAAEALLGMLSTNIFWVRGTAALLTHDTTRQVPRGQGPREPPSLRRVRHVAATPGRPLGLAGQHHLPERHQRPDVLPGACHLAALAVSPS